MHLNIYLILLLFVFLTNQACVDIDTSITSLTSE